MTFTCSRKSLVTELALLQAVSERKVTIPVLQTVMLGVVGDVLTLTATDLDCTLITEIDAAGDPWGGCVPSRQLYDLVRLLDGDEVTFTPVENRLEVRYNKSKHRLPTLPITDFPEIDQPVGEAFTLPLPLLQQMVEATAFALLEPSGTHSPADLKYTGLSLRADGTTLEVMGTMKVVTAVAETPLATPPFATVLPRAVATLLLKLDGETVAMSSDPHGVRLVVGSRTIIARPLMGEFPKWRDFLPRYEWAITVDADALTTAIRRASVTMGTDNAVGYEAMKATFSRDELSVETRGGTSGHSLEPVSVTSNMNGDALAVGVISKQLLAVLAKCEGATQCQLAAANQPLMFTNETARYVVMPVALKW